MASLDEALLIVYEDEGGLTNDKGDRGGITNLGLTIVDLTKYYKRPATADDVRALNRETAKPIYRALYWDVMRLDEVSDQKLADILMDQGVLNGVGTVVMEAQSLVDAVVDGKVGPETIQKINLADPKRLSALLVATELRRYVGIAERTPTQEKFLKGWINRAAEMLVIAFQ